MRYSLILSILIFLMTPGKSFAAAFDPDTGCTLTTSQAEYWQLDEASGSRSAEINGNTLTDNNTVGSAAGIKSNAADFESTNSEYFNAVDSASLSMGDVDFSIVCWVKFESLPTVGGQFGIIGKGNQLTAQGGEYYIRYNDGNDLFEFIVANNVSKTTLTASTFGTASTATWYMIYAYHDATANEMGISIDNGTVDTASVTHGSYDSSDDFIIGRELDQNSQYMDGLIDEVGIWDKVLTATEVTDLYNSGSGNTYDSTGTCVSFTPRIIVY